MTEPFLMRPEIVDATRRRAAIQSMRTAQVNLPIFSELADPLLDLGAGPQVLVIGDAVYTLRSLREEILPLLTVDDGAYLRSLREIKAFAESAPDATLANLAWTIMGIPQ